MNASTFFEIKYMNGIFLYIIQIGFGLKILAPTPIPNYPQVTPPRPHPPPQKRFIPFLKYSLNVFIKESRVIIFREKDKIKLTKPEIILAQNDDGPLKWDNDLYLIQSLQISKKLMGLLKFYGHFAKFDGLNNS